VSKSITIEHDPDTLTIATMPTAEVARRLHNACTRLYSERSMGGDEMRDMAQSLQAILDSIYTER